jgi:large subunit ribosomal protein L15
MRLNELRDNPGATQPRKRVGRGIGSGTGKTAARGHKGQKSRSGGNPPPGFEGGQMPLYRRLPKRGFKNPTRKEFAEVNLRTLQRAIDTGKLDAAQTIDESAMQTAGLFKRRRDGVRVLAKGELSTKVTIQVTGASKAAISAVEKAGGNVIVTGGGGRAVADSEAKPKSKVAKSKRGGAKPEPEAADSKSDAAKPKPEAAKAKSDAAKPKPEAAKSKPDDAKPKPEAAKSKPDASKPKSDASKPKSDAAKPKQD